MLEILRTVTPSPEQWEIIIEGARNPMESWGKSDSSIEWVVNEQTGNMAAWQFHMGDADHDLLMRLAKAGTDHGKYLRQAPVWVTLTAPLYWWKEMDAYKVGTVRNSCSTMHKIHSRPLTMDDFSVESLTAIELQAFDSYLRIMEANRKMYLSLDGTEAKVAWERMIQLLPSSYNQRSTMKLNYAVLRNIYHSRKNHKLTEWHTFCRWIETLPYSDLITG